MTPASLEDLRHPSLSCKLASSARTARWSERPYAKLKALERRCRRAAAPGRHSPPEVAAAGPQNSCCGIAVAGQRLRLCPARCSSLFVLVSAVVDRLQPKRFGTPTPHDRRPVWRPAAAP
jgi:hypothetical protein